MYVEMNPFVRSVTVLALLVICTACTCLAVPEDSTSSPSTLAKEDHTISQEEIKRYMTILQSLNVEQIVNNDRLMTNNVKCFLNEGPCTSQLKEMKKFIPLIVKDTCSSCTNDQKKMVKKVMDTIEARRPDDFGKLTKMFDPEGVYHKKFLENLKESK